VALGEAAWRARLAARRASPDRPDWLAYTLFGDPRARPYLPEVSQGYAALACRDPEPDGTLRPERPYTFQASISRRPPEGYRDRLIQAEELPEGLQALFLLPGLQTGFPEPVPMSAVGRHLRQATTVLRLPQPGDYPLVVQLLEGDEHLKTLQVNLRVRADGDGGDGDD
jgi:hypothetical protein